MTENIPNLRKKNTRMVIKNLMVINSKKSKPRNIKVKLLKTKTKKRL